MLLLVFDNGDMELAEDASDASNKINCKNGTSFTIYELKKLKTKIAIEIVGIDDDNQSDIDDATVQNTLNAEKYTQKEPSTGFEIPDPPEEGG